MNSRIKKAKAFRTKKSGSQASPSQSESQIMKKFIAVLGVAGLLLPGAAFAGGVDNSTGSSAYRETGASTSLSRVRMHSNIRVDNKMDVKGRNHGTSYDISAENLTVGGRHGGYAYGTASGQVAANIAADELVAGTYHVDGDTHTAQGNALGNYEFSNWGATGQGAIEGAYSTTDLSGSSDGIVTDGAGSTNGAANISADGFIGTGGEWFVNGSASGSRDTYSNKYKGTLKEKGLITTNVHAVTSTSDTFEGFASSSFQATGWQ